MRFFLSLLLTLASSAVTHASSQRPLNHNGPQFPLLQFRYLMELQQDSSPSSLKALEQSVKQALEMDDDGLRQLHQTLQNRGALSGSELPPWVNELVQQQALGGNHAGELQQSIEELNRRMQRLDQQSRQHAAESSTNAGASDTLSGQSSTPAVSDVSGPRNRRAVGKAKSRRDRENGDPRQPSYGGRASAADRGTNTSALSSREDQNGRAVKRPAPPSGPSAESGSGERWQPQDNRPSTRSDPPGTHLNGRNKQPNATPTTDPAGGTSSRRTHPRGAGSNPGRKLSYESLSRDLERRGLEHTILRLVEDAQKRVDTAGARETDDGAVSDSSVWGRLISGVADRVRHDVVDLVQSGRSVNRPRSTESPSRPSSPLNTPRGESASSNSELAGASSGAAATDSSEADNEFGSMQTPSLDELIRDLPEEFSADWIFPLLLIVGLISGAAVLLTRRAPVITDRQREAELNPVHPTQIRTREDVVRAYHWLTACKAPDSADWWHHRRALECMAMLSPDQRLSMQQLARLYEAARYESDAEIFDRARIQAARQALAECVRGSAK